MTNPRINADSFYVNGAAIPASYFAALDTAQSQEVNGNSGGTWNPSTGLGIGGAGMVAAGPWSIGSSPAIEVPSGSPLRVTLGADDWIGLGPGHTGNTRQLRTSFADGADVSFWTPGNAVNGQPRLQADFASQGGLAQGVNTTGAYAGGAGIIVPLRVHDGAGSTSGPFTAVFHFLVTYGPRSSLPDSQPKFRLFALGLDGSVTNLCTNATLLPEYVGNGFVQLQAANATAYYNGGAVQTQSYELDDGTVFDTSRFAYFAEIVDEAGNNSSPGNLFVCVVQACVNIFDTRPQ
jgi:hypothetical protein